jgi:hypothetical protein
MTDKFTELFESTYPTSLKLIKRTIYPREMKFSEEFLESLKSEYNRLKVIEENGEMRPIKNLREKFTKAVDFRLNGFDGDLPSTDIPEAILPSEEAVEASEEGK